MPGPPPKREEERRRRNKNTVPTTKVNLDDLLAQEVEIPAPPYAYANDDGEELDEPVALWHPIAEEWYLALMKSGQSIFYEPSDWMTAYMVAEQISLAMEPRPTVIGQDGDGKPVIRTMVIPMPGSTLTAILKASSSLMATEGDRRRLRIELERKKAQDAALGNDGVVVSIAKSREDVFNRPDRSEMA